MKGFLLSIILMSAVSMCFGQSARKLNRAGVEHYKKGEYEKAEQNYKKALQKQSQLIESSYNLALSYYKQENYSQAITQFKNTLNKTSDKELQAKLYHNLGNSYLQENKLKESIDAYQNSLRINPSDEETRYNLTYALMKFKARQKQKEDSKNLMDKIEQEEKVSQQFMRRNKNMGKEVKNW